MYPHERSLVKRLQDKPFALLGVNSDTDRPALEKTLVKEQLNWRSWWNGGGKKGPIATAWNIQFWPTIYVIDGKGVIRYKNVQDKRLDDALDKLVGEIEQH
jgi:hypothetical protein